METRGQLSDNIQFDKVALLATRVAYICNTSAPRASSLLKTGRFPPSDKINAMRARTLTCATDRSGVLTNAVAETAKRLDIGPSDLAAIIGVSQSSASRMLAGGFRIKEGTPEWQLSALLVRLYRSLFSIVGGNDSSAKEWLVSANRAFDGRRPIDVMKTIVGLVSACDYVDRAQV